MFNFDFYCITAFMVYLHFAIINKFDKCYIFNEYFNNIFYIRRNM